MRTDRVVFVSCVSAQGFRLLLASPDAGYKLFRGLQSDGHGQAKLFEGRTGVNDRGGSAAVCVCVCLEMNKLVFLNTPKG